MQYQKGPEQQGLRGRADSMVLTADDPRLLSPAPPVRDLFLYQPDLSAFQDATIGTSFDPKCKQIQPLSFQVQRGHCGQELLKRPYQNQQNERTHIAKLQQSMRQAPLQNLPPQRPLPAVPQQGPSAKVKNRFPPAGPLPEQDRQVIKNTMGISSPTPPQAPKINNSVLPQLQTSELRKKPRVVFAHQMKASETILYDANRPRRAEKAPGPPERPGARVKTSYSVFSGQQRLPPIQACPKTPFPIPPREKSLSFGCFGRKGNAANAQQARPVNMGSYRVTKASKTKTKQVRKK